jgi:hypothetical protein
MKNKRFMPGLVAVLLLLLTASAVAANLPKTKLTQTTNEKPLEVAVVPLMEDQVNQVNTDASGMAMVSLDGNTLKYMIAVDDVSSDLNSATFEKLSDEEFTVYRERTLNFQNTRDVNRERTRLNQETTTDVNQNQEMTPVLDEENVQVNPDTENTNPALDQTQAQQLPEEEQNPENMPRQDQPEQNQEGQQDNLQIQNRETQQNVEREETDTNTGGGWWTNINERVFNIRNEDQDVVHTAYFDGRVAQGSFELSDEEMQAMQDGNLFIVVKTDQYPEGELRGQLVSSSS